MSRRTLAFFTAGEKLVQHGETRMSASGLYWGTAININGQQLSKKYLSTDDTDGCPQADGGM